jgi:hypothetical protein
MPKSETRETRVVCPQDRTLNSTVRCRRLSVHDTAWSSTHTQVHTCMHTSIHPSIHPSINPSGQIQSSNRSARLCSSRGRNKSSTGHLLRFGLVGLSGARLGASSGIGRAGRRSKTKTADSALVVHRSETTRWPVPPKCQFNLSAPEKLLRAGIISKWTSED